MLLAHALAGSGSADRGRVETLVGRPDLDGPQVDELRGIIEGSGAVGVLEDEIGRLAAAARTALDDAPSLDAPAREALLELVDVATARTA